MDKLRAHSNSVFELLDGFKVETKEKLDEFSNDLDLFVKSIVDPVTVDRTPIRSKKKARQNTNDANASTRLDATQTSNTSLANASTCRPSRQAATKALAGLKEPTLNVKLRNEGPVPVKLERVSLHNAQQRLATKENDNPNRPNTPTEELTQKARKMSLHETPARAAPTPMDESLIVMPAKQMDVVTLSDGDDEPAAAPAVESVASTALDPALMPPPSKPAPVTRKPRTKRNIKSEKLSLVAAPAVPDEPQRSTRSKKPHGVPKPMEIVKAEPLGDAMPMELQSDASPVCVDSSPEHASTESPEPVFDRNEGVPATANATIESVYEDARADELPRTSEALPPYTEEPMDAQSAGDETAQPIEAAVREALPQPMDATYVQPADANITYAAVVCNTTYVAPAAAAGNETFQVPAAVAAGNETVCLGPAPGKTDAVSSTNKARSSSLMTDDISDEDEIPLSRMPTLKTKHKELFNPCIQSPMKKKVEAFERHALQEVAQQSPVPVRSTRTKTRAQDPSIEEDVESAVQKAQRSLIKAPSTPNLAWKSGLPAPSTPQQRLQQFSASLSTLNGVPGAFHSANAPKRLPSTSSATSKLAHMNRPASAKAPSVAQRESSAEDVRRGLKDLADEKRRKREEKLKQVQLQRELREKERAEKYAKQLQEKEEKAQQEAERKRLLKERKDKEAEQKAAQDKIQRQVKMQAAKDAERARIDRELLEAERKERELLDTQRIQAEKLAMQQKLKQNMLAQQARKKTTKYNWDLLHTDDETDDENNVVDGRPGPPEWSLSSNRTERITSQSHIQSAIVDGFFSTQPMTPNLKELFPDISERHLKRNSSAVWNTPPRYSTMDVPRYPQ